MKECILPHPTTNFDEVVKWMETNIGPCTFYDKNPNGVQSAEGKIGLYYREYMKEYIKS